MKRLVLMIVTALICGLTIFLASSCNKENSANSALNVKVVGFLGEHTTKCYLEIVKIDTLLFSGDNILWYNETTSEVKFKSNPNGNYFLSVFGGLVSIIVCLDETELFTLDAMTSISSYSINHPVLIYGSAGSAHGGESDFGYYIGRGYPDWAYWTEKFWTDTNWDRTADWVKEREKNWKAIELGWNKFIAQLEKEGKYRK